MEPLLSKTEDDEIFNFLEMSPIHVKASFGRMVASMNQQRANMTEKDLENERKRNEKVKHRFIGGGIPTGLATLSTN